VDTILHVIDIHALPEDVFRAVSTGEGLAGWWSTQVEASEEVGGVVHFTFESGFNPDMEITGLDSPGLVSWRCVGGHDPWLDSTFSFATSALGNGHSRLVFRQGYGKPISDVEFGIYNFNWGYYLHSLKQLVETGQGTPYQPS
jgi:uncharacterized protein YndB with AHSA1/START domain